MMYNNLSEKEKYEKAVKNIIENPWKYEYTSDKWKLKLKKDKRIIKAMLEYKLKEL